jgi:hypothetical protein
VTPPVMPLSAPLPESFRFFFPLGFFGGRRGPRILAAAARLPKGYKTIVRFFFLFFFLGIWFYSHFGEGRRRAGDQWGWTREAKSRKNRWMWESGIYACASACVFAVLAHCQHTAAEVGNGKALCPVKTEREGGGEEAVSTSVAFRGQSTRIVFVGAPRSAKKPEQLFQPGVLCVLCKSCVCSAHQACSEKQPQ